MSLYSINDKEKVKYNDSIEQNNKINIVSTNQDTNIISSIHSTYPEKKRAAIRSTSHYSLNNEFDDIKTSKNSKSIKSTKKIAQNEYMVHLSGLQIADGKGTNDFEKIQYYECKDNITKIPYKILGQADYHNTKENLVIFHDIFDTLDSTQIFFQRIINENRGCQILLFNYPGQADTTFPIEKSTNKEAKNDKNDKNDTNGILFNNVWICEKIIELFNYINESHRFSFESRSFHFVGFGNGANLAIYSIIHYPNFFKSSILKSIVLLNGFLSCDKQLATILHNSIHVFSCFPPKRPDLPISYFTKYLFSDSYLSKVNINLALNIYTAVANPITLEGRIRLCKGALHHIDLKNLYKKSSIIHNIPLIFIQSTENSFIHPTNADIFLENRNNLHIWSHQHHQIHSLTDKIKTQLIQILSINDKNSHNNHSLVLWFRAGHELRQEMKSILQDIFIQLTQKINIENNKNNEEKVHNNTSSSIQSVKKKRIISSYSIDIKSQDTIERNKEIDNENNYYRNHNNNNMYLNIHDSIEIEQHQKKTENEYENAMRIYQEQQLKPYPSIPKVLSSNNNLNTNIPYELSIIEDTTIEKMKDQFFSNINDKNNQIDCIDNTNKKDNKNLFQNIQNEQELRHRNWEEKDQILFNRIQEDIYSNKNFNKKNDILDTFDTYTKTINSYGTLSEEFLRNISNPLDQSLIIPSIYSETKKHKDFITSSQNKDSLIFSNTLNDFEKKEEFKSQRNILKNEEYDLIRREVHKEHMVKETFYKNSKEKIISEHNNHFAIKIQKIIRGFITRKKILKNLNNKKKKEMAGATLVRIGKGYIGRIHFKKQKKLKNELLVYKEATIIIQKTNRRFIARKGYNDKLKNKKISQIQRMYRGFKGRTRVAKMKDMIKDRKIKNIKATKIQSVWKMRKNRDQYLRQRVIQLATIEIQRTFRGYRSRKKTLRMKLWENAEPGPERIELGLKMIEESKIEFEKQQKEINTLHQSQEITEKRISDIYNNLKESEKELAILEKELLEVDQIENDLHELTHEAEMLKKKGIASVKSPLNSGLKTENHDDTNHLNYGFETKEEIRKRQADIYALDMAIEIKKNEREKKKKELEAEFASVFSAVQGKRKNLNQLEEKLSDMEALRVRKDREFGRMQRNLMELLEEQKYELDLLREKGIELETATATSAAAAAATAYKAKENEERSKAMFESTEELMKFQFMSMSLSYFSSLNMLKNLRTINSDTTASAITSTANTAATAAAAAAAANIPTMKKLKLNTDEILDLKSKKKKKELEIEKEKEIELINRINAPFPPQVRLWSCDDVSRWLDTLSLSQYKEAFKQAAIDGEFLLELREEDMVDVLGMNHKLHIRKVILSRDKLRPLDEIEIMQKNAVLYEDSLINKPNSIIDINNNNKIAPDIETMFSLARNGRIKKLEENLNDDFNINSEDDKGNTLLSIACQNMNRNMVELLLKKKANINHQNAQGNTPLHFAMAYDKVGILGEYLIEHGADDTLENIFGLSPYDGIAPD